MPFRPTEAESVAAVVATARGRERGRAHALQVLQACRARLAAALARLARFPKEIP